MVGFVRDEATGLPIGPVVEAGAAERPRPGLVLSGTHVRLEPIDPGRHAPALFRAVAAERDALWLYLFDQPPADEDTLRQQLTRMAGSTDPFFLAIVDAQTGDALGTASFMRIEPTHRVIEIGNILFSPLLQKRPAATEAMALMAAHAFDALGYRRYEWKCNALNAPSRRAAARLGFTEEGTFRDHMIVKGRSRDTAWFSMTAAEWPARRAAFARWLAPSNFGPDGRQHMSLSALNATELSGGPLRLRRATSADADALDHLQRAAYTPNRAIIGAEPLPLTVPGAAILSRYETWLAEDGNGLAGALALDPAADHLLLWSVAVHPARQGERIGSHLLEAAAERARQLGLPLLRLYTAEALAGNVAWYGRQGYTIDRVETLPDRRLVHMSKPVQQ